MANPWFRLYSEAVDDEKLRLLAFEDRWHFVAILCCKCQGILDGENTGLIWRKVAVKLGLDMDELRDLHQRLADAGLMDGDMNPSAHLIATEVRPPASEWRAIRDQVFSRDDYTCQYCGKRGVRLECDHVHPVAKGGGHEMSNLVTACFHCNRSKRDKTVEEWRHHG